METRQVYGLYLQQKRNNVQIDAKLFENITTKNKSVSNLRLITIFIILII